MPIAADITDPTINTTTPCPFALARQNLSFSGSHSRASEAPLPACYPANSAAISQNSHSRDIAPAEADETAEAPFSGSQPRTISITDPIAPSAIDDGNIIPADNSLSPHRGTSLGGTGTGQLYQDGGAGNQFQQELQENQVSSSQQHNVRSRRRSISGADTPDRLRSPKRRRVQPEGEQEFSGIVTNSTEREKGADSNGKNDTVNMRADEGSGSSSSPDTSDDAAHLPDPTRVPVSTTATSSSTQKHINPRSSAILNDSIDKSGIHHAQSNGRSSSDDPLYSIRSAFHLQPHPYRGHNREEVTRILIQGLQDLGYHSAAGVLSKESGYRLESPMVSQFRTSILHGNWNEAELIMAKAFHPEGLPLAIPAGIDGDVAHNKTVQHTQGHGQNQQQQCHIDNGHDRGLNGDVEDPQSLILLDGSDKTTMMFSIKQQKFLELVDRRDIPGALMVLQRELTPLHNDVLRLHALSR